MPTKAHGVIPGHGALVPEAKHAIQGHSFGNLPVGRPWLGGWHPKKDAVPEKEALQHLVSLLQGASPSQP